MGGMRKKQPGKGPKNLRATRAEKRQQSRQHQKCVCCSMGKRGVRRSTWKRYKGTYDFFVGIEHRMKKEEMEEYFNKEARQGWGSTSERRNQRGRKRDDTMLERTIQSPRMTVRTT